MNTEEEEIISAIKELIEQGEKFAIFHLITRWHVEVELPKEVSEIMSNCNGSSIIFKGRIGEDKEIPFYLVDEIFRSEWKEEERTLKLISIKKIQQY